MGCLVVFVLLFMWLSRDWSEKDGKNNYFALILLNIVFTSPFCCYYCNNFSLPFPHSNSNKSLVAQGMWEQHTKGTYFICVFLIFVVVCMYLVQYFVILCVEMVCVSHIMALVCAVWNGMIFYFTLFCAILVFDRFW